MINLFRDFIKHRIEILFLSVIMLCAPAPAQSGEYRLTEEQFLASVEIRSNNGIPWAIYRAFPIQKKVELLARLQRAASLDDYEFEANYLRALSYLVNEDDIEIINKLYIERISGVKKDQNSALGMSQDQMLSLGHFLGNCLSRRNSPKCENLIWAILESTKDSNGWYDKEVLRNKKELGLSYKIVLIEGLAAFIDFKESGPNGRLSIFKDQLRKFMKDNVNIFGSLSWRLSQDALAIQFESRQRTELAGITADDYNIISKQFRNNSIPRKVATDRLAEDRAMAMKSYSVVSGAFISRSFNNEVYGLMLDNAMPFAKVGAMDERELRRLDEFSKNEKEIDRESHIINEVAKIMPGALDLSRHSDISVNTFMELPSGGYVVDLVNKREISIPINGSQEIVKKFNLSASSKSISPDGRLQLYFLCIEGRWMWLPYGW